MSSEKLQTLKMEIYKFQKNGKTLKENVLQSLKSVLLNAKSVDVLNSFVRNSNFKEGSRILADYKNALEFYRVVSKYFSKDYIEIAQMFGYAARIVKGEVFFAEIIDTNKLNNNTYNARKKAKDEITHNETLPEWKGKLLKFKNKHH